MRFKAGTVGLAMLALLVCAPAALAGDRVAARRDDRRLHGRLERGHGQVVALHGQPRELQPGRRPLLLPRQRDAGSPPARAASAAGSGMSACRVTSGLKRYDFNDRRRQRHGQLRLQRRPPPAALPTSAPGDDRFTGRQRRIRRLGHGGDGNDVLAARPATTSSTRRRRRQRRRLLGEGGNDQVTGQAGNDRLDGGPGDDSLEFAAAGRARRRGRGGRRPARRRPASTSSATTSAPSDRALARRASRRRRARARTTTSTATSRRSSPPRSTDRLTGSDLGQDLYGNGGNDHDRRPRRRRPPQRRHGRRRSSAAATATTRSRARPAATSSTAGPGATSSRATTSAPPLPCTGGADQILARDNEEDTVNCGVGADRATVDLLDIVATDSQQGCESIDRAALPVPARPVGEPPAIGRRPLRRMSIRGVARHPHAGGARASWSR